MDLTELGTIVAEQMERITEDFAGREEEFHYEGSISIVLYRNADEEAIRVRFRCNMCPNCALKGLHIASQEIIMKLECLS